jgi:hypothetical protein
MVRRKSAKRGTSVPKGCRVHNVRVKVGTHSIPGKLSCKGKLHFTAAGRKQFTKLKKVCRKKAGHVCKYHRKSTRRSSHSMLGGWLS